MKSACCGASSFIEPNAFDSGPTRPEEQSAVAIRGPRAADAAAVWSLVQKSRVLDANSAYAYLLLCTDFASTGAVAEADDEIVGFILGYRPPVRPDAFFVWQVAVAERLRGRGLAGALLDHAVARALADGMTFLEATVTPSNGASWSLFRGFARRAGVACHESPAYPSHLFPDGDHEDEVRIRIGPLDPEFPRLRPCP